MSKLEIHFELVGENCACLQARPAQGLNYTAPDLDLQRKLWHLAHLLKQNYACRDVVPGMNNLSVIFDPSQDDGELWLDRLRQYWQKTKASTFSQRRIIIPTQYGGKHGPDLALVAEHAELSIDEVVRLHSEAHYTVYFLGFQPGFAYMGGLPARLTTPRRAEPRLLVPAGSVGIGGSQTGIYPSPSPGGWQLIAWTPVRLFDPSLASPSLLLPGDLVRFTVESCDV